MRSIVLYIATSVDGFIADANGQVGWLDPYSVATDSYDRFIEQVDTILMGWNTYEQVTRVLSVGQWPYEKQTTYVFTHRSMTDTPKIRFVDEEPRALVSMLKKQSGKTIWVCGGATLIHQLMDEIDRFDLTIVPVLLGNGIPLFSGLNPEQALKLEKFIQYDSVIEVVYSR